MEPAASSDPSRELEPWTASMGRGMENVAPFRNGSMGSSDQNFGSRKKDLNETQGVTTTEPTDSGGTAVWRKSGTLCRQ